MRRVVLFLLTILFLIAALVAAFATQGSPEWIGGIGISAIFVAIGAVAALDQLWDRFRPRKEKSAVFSIPNETAYLEGRLREFQKEHEQFIALAGNAVIPSRYDAYADAFTTDQPSEKIHEYTDIAQAAAEHDRFVFVGEPGAGKSTNLRHMAEAVVRVRLNPNEKRPTWLPQDSVKPPLALWIFLGDSQNPPEVDALLDHWWMRYNLPGSAKTAVTNHDLWLFMDGLNEMPEQKADRKTRAANLRQWLDQHPHVPAIITCRVRDYDNDLNLGLPVIHIQSLDNTRIAEFIRKRGGDDLLAKIESNNALQSISHNPYTLAMLTDIYKTKGQLPTDLYNLYEIYTNLRHAEYFRAGKVKLNWKKLKSQLGYLGFRMIAAQRGTATPTKWAQRKIGQRTLEDGINLGVLVEEGADMRFYHQSLHSYFALPSLRQALKQRWYDPIIGIQLVIVILPLFTFTYLVSRLGLISYRNRSWPYRLKEVFWAMDFRRVIFVGALRDMGQAATPAIPLLIEILHDRSISVRRVAIKTLGAMGETAESAIPALIALLDDADKDIRLVAAEALGNIGKIVIPQVLDVLNHKDGNALRTAIFIIWIIGEEAELAVPALISALSDSDVYVRRLAAIALERIGSASLPAVSVLNASLKDLDVEVRWAAASALGKIGQYAVSAVPSLIHLLSDTNKSQFGRINDTAAEALEKIGTPEALEAVLQWRKKEIDLPETPPNPNQIQIDT